MDMILKRLRCTEAGCFSYLNDETGAQVAVTAEHAYQDVNTAQWLPKLPVGTYTCVRGIHRLADLVPFETFEITGVPNHVGILFHTGNTEQDSDGCVLLGTYFGDLEVACKPMDSILNSRAAFSRFMVLQNGVTEFELFVSWN